MRTMRSSKLRYISTLYPEFLSVPDIDGVDAFMSTKQELQHGRLKSFPDLMLMPSVIFLTLKVLSSPYSC